MENYRDLIKEELFARKKQNTNYSLRAFARDLKVSQPFLSQIISGKKKLSAEKALLKIKQLNWPAQRRRNFIKSVNLESLKNPQAKDVLEKDLSPNSEDSLNIQSLREDTFNVIADWYHFAILELTQMRNFKPEIKWMAKKLGLDTKLIDLAVLRLRRLGLLKKTLTQPMLKTHDNYSFANTPSQAIKIHQKQSMDLASEALIHDPLDSREFVTLTFAFDSKRMDEAKKHLREFYSDFLGEFQSRNADSVYKLSFQLFRLDKEIK